jgi:hypothetical protein
VDQIGVARNDEILNMEYTSVESPPAPANPTFAGSMTLISRSGAELPFQEFKNLVSGLNFALPERAATTTRAFWLSYSGPDNALVVRYCDDRKIDNRNAAAGTGTIVAGLLSATVTFGGYTVTISGTVSGSTLAAATITTTFMGVTSVHSCTLATNGPCPVWDPGIFISQWGDDGNDGLTLATPIRSFSAPTNSGVYYLVRQSIFSSTADRFVDETKTFSVSDAGEGHWPVGNQLDVISSWADATGGAWSATYSAHVGADASTGYPQAVEDGFPLTQVADLATCKSTAGSYYTPTTIGTSPTTVTMYIHPTGSGNPNSNGKTYECTVRETFLAGKGSCSFTQIHHRGATTPSGGAIIRAGATDGTDAGHMNIFTTHGVYHNAYAASASHSIIGSMFCQTSGGANSAYVQHRSGTDSVPQSFTVDEIFHIESPYRARNSNEALFDMHADSQLGTWSLGNPYLAYGMRVYSIGSGMSAGTVTNPLVDRCAGGNAPLFYGGNGVTITNLQHISRESTYWPMSPWVTNGSASVTLIDPLAVGSWGGTNPNSTFDGLWTPDGGATAPAATTNRLIRATVVNLDPTGATYSRRCAVYLGQGAPLSGPYKSDQIDNCLFVGCAPDVQYGAIDNTKYTKIPGDHSSFDTGAGQFYWNNSIDMGLSGLQGGWFGTLAASDANSVQSATIFTNTTGRYPTYTKTSSNPGGSTATYIDPATRWGVMVETAFRNAGRLPA